MEWKKNEICFGVGLIFIGVAIALFGYVSSSNIVLVEGFRAYNPDYVYYTEWLVFQIVFFTLV